MKLEIRLDSNDTYSVVDAHFDPYSVMDPAGVFGKNKPLLAGLTKEDAQSILKIAEQSRLIGFHQGLQDVSAFVEQEQKNIR